MNPTPEAIEAIRDRVSDWTPLDAEIAAALNEATEANPEPQGSIPRQITIERLMAECQVPPEEIAALVNSGLLMAIRDDAAAQDRGGLATLAQCALIAGLIEQSTYATVLAWLQGTDPEPDYQPLLSWAELNLGRSVDAGDLAASRPGPPKQEL